jgi:hypothetical protein
VIAPDRRDPLTQRFARELREVDPDPKAWIEPPPQQRDPWHRYDPVVLLVAAILCVTFIGSLAWALAHYLNWF